MSMQAGSAERLDELSANLLHKSDRAYKIYQQSHNPKHLNEAILLAQQSLVLEEGKDRPDTLSKLGRWKSQVYERSGEPDDLGEAVSYSEKAYALSRDLPDHINRSSIIDGLARRLFERYQSNVGTYRADLSRSISLSREAMKHADSNGQPISSMLNLLSLQLRERFSADSKLDDLKEAIFYGREAIKATQNDQHNHLASRETNLGSSLKKLYEETREGKYLEEAIDLQRRAVQHTDNTNLMLPARLCNLGNALGKQFQRSYKFADLMESLKFHQESYDKIEQSTSQSHRSNIINCYSVRLLWHFEQTNESSSLDKSLRLMASLVQDAPRSSLSWLDYVANLCNRLLTRYDVDGASEDIQEAIEWGEKAINSVLVRSYPIQRARFFCSLSQALLARYRRTSALSDLKSAIDYSIRAKEAVHFEHLLRPYVLENLSLALFTRYGRLNDRKDLDEAITFGQTAADTALEDDKSGLAHSNVGILYGIRYQESQDENDLQKAIESCQKGVELGVPHYSRFVNLAHWLRVGFQSSIEKDPLILDRAIDLAERALEMTEKMPDCPEKSRIALEIAEARGQRFRLCHGRASSERDQERSKEVLDKMMRLKASPPTDRINCALYLANIASAERDWTRVYKAMEAAVRDIPSISPRCVQQRDQQYSLSQFPGLACQATAAALLAEKTAIEALQLLERGRSVISNHRFERRVDISHLRNAYPELATRFKEACEILDGGNRGQGIIVSSEGTNMSTRYGAETELLDIIKEINEHEEFKNFLRPKDPKLLLRGKPAEYIVVINVTFRSDAFLIRENRIDVLPLPKLLRAKAAEYGQKLRASSLSPSTLYRILEWLWDTTVGPVLEGLDITSGPSGNDWPHIHWVPTGSLSHLPLHAAGYHLDSSARTVMDRAVSSYSPSIKFIEYSFENSRRLLNRGPQPRDRAIIASMEVTKHMQHLPQARGEAKAIGRLLKGQINVNEIEQPSRSYIMGELRHCSIFHFSGHAKADLVDPLRSCLVVDDGFVTIEDLLDEKLHLNPPILAYLSACSTGVSRVDSLVEEGIHLAATLLAVGFQNVIASMWKVPDDHSARVAEVVYREIAKAGIKGQSVAVSLHHALRSIRTTGLAGSSDQKYYRQYGGIGPNITGAANEARKGNRRLAYPDVWISFTHMGFYTG